MHPVHGVGCADIVRTVSKEGQVKVGGSVGHCHVHVEAANSNQAISRHVVVERVALVVTTLSKPGDIEVCQMLQLISAHLLNLLCRKWKFIRAENTVSLQKTP